MPTIQQREACPHCKMMNLADFLGPTALAVQARGICPNCLKWQATGLEAYNPGRVPATPEEAAGGTLEAYNPGRVPATPEEAAGGTLEINRTQTAAAAD